MKRRLFNTAFCTAAVFALVLASCASSKKVAAPAGEEDSAAVAEGGATGSAVDAVEQNAVLGADGTVAENVPHVDKETPQKAAPAAVESPAVEERPAPVAEQPKKETPAEKKARLEAEKAEKQKRREADKIARKQRKDNYTGWVYIPAKNFTLTNGDIKLTLRGNTGSFEIYAIPETGKPVPLLATYDEFCSTFFSLMVGRKEYRLNREAGVKSEARKTEYGAQMAYTIPDKAQIVVDFSFMPSIATSSRIDMLRVTVYTINLGKSTQSFTVKSVFDTMLGENTVTHFSTAAHSRINSETQFTDMDTEKWIRSGNEKAVIQFLLNGRGITNPKAVTLGNKDFLALPTWLPVVQETRSFNSVLAYNNSSMAINWKTAYLDPMKTDVITFYISVATDGNEPAGKEFIAQLNAGRTALPSNLPNTVQTTTVAPEPVEVPSEAAESAYHENMPAISGESTVPSTATMQEGKVLDTESPAEAQVLQSPSVYGGNGASAATGTAVSPTAVSKPYSSAAPVTKEQLDPEYIQRLLDRIADLESDPALVDKAEVKRLNDELDRILETLRSKN